MAHKEFRFDFNEDADPVEELHRLRVAATKHLKTMKATLKFLHSVPTAEEFLAKSDAKGRKQTPQTTQFRKSKNTRNPAMRRKTAKRTARA